MRRHFLLEAAVEVFVFSDAELPPGVEAQRIPVKDPGPGRVEVERFRWLPGMESQLAEFDFLVVMRPHARIVERIHGEDIRAEGLVACPHSFYAGEARRKIRFEENEASVAWVGPTEGRIYHCGGWLSGPPRELLAAVRLMAEWAAQDDASGVRPRWGAESYWNRYLIDLPPVKVLGPEYAWRVGTRQPEVPVKALLQRTREVAGEGDQKPRRPERRMASRLWD